MSNWYKGKRSSEPTKGQPVFVGPEYDALSANDVHEGNYNTTTNNNVILALSDSGIYFTELGNHRLTCVLLDTGATVSVLNEGTWKKRGNVSRLGLVTGTLTTN